MIGNVTFGLEFVAGNANLTFIYFIALVLLAVLGTRFTVYAHLNGRASELGDQVLLWRSLSVVGLTATLYAVLWLVDVMSSLQTPFRRAVLLAHVLSLAFVLTVLARDAIPAGSDSGPGDPGQIFWVGGGIAAVVVLVGAAIAPANRVLLAIDGVSALVFAAVGFAVGWRGASASRVQGTVVDSLLRHLLPVLLFASLVPIMELAVVAGLDRAVVLHIQVVFVIMTATALMTATIKLRQNLAGL